MQRRDVNGIQPFDAPRDVLRPERRRVDHDLAHQTRRLGAAGVDAYPVVAHRAAETRAAESHERAVRFGIPFEREHVLVDVDDAGRRREQRARA